MISMETRIEIGRPAADVFAFVSDQTNAPRWQSGLDEVHRLTPGPIGVGSEHSFVRRFAGRRIESRNSSIDTGPGDAAGTQPVRVRTTQVVILGRQVDDRAGRLGHPVGLPELALEDLDALPQDRLADR